jgi:hypothetical protein
MTLYYDLSFWLSRHISLKASGSISSELAMMGGKLPLALVDRSVRAAFTSFWREGFTRDFCKHNFSAATMKSSARFLSDPSVSKTLLMQGSACLRAERDLAKGIHVAKLLG